MGNEYRVVTDLLSEPRNSEPFERLVRESWSAPGSLGPVVQELIDRKSRPWPFFDAILSFLEESEVPDLLEFVFERWQSGRPNDAAASFVAHMSLQFPHLLRPHLVDCWQLRPNQGTYYEYWPWRGADDAEIARLKECFGDRTQKPRALRCLLETGRPSDVREAALGLAGDLSVEAWLNSVGFTLRGDGLLPLFSRRTLHLRLPRHVLKGVTTFKTPDIHPSWGWFPVGKRSDVCNFGGLLEATCGFCDGPLHRLIAPLGVLAGPPRVTFATCISCLGWETTPMFFAHDREGEPTRLNRDGTATGFRKRTPRYPSAPPTLIPAELVTVPPRWSSQDWGLSNGRENLHRVGGRPCWVQSANYPTCPRCKTLMPFVAQLDSGLPIDHEKQLIWGSGGMFYVFWCADCHVSANHWQCT